MKAYKDYLIEWIKSEVKSIGADGVVVGLSGGIDSAVVSALAKEAFPNDSIGIWMGIESSENAHKNTINHANKIDIEFKDFDLTNILDHFIDVTLKGEKNEERFVEAKGNTKARLRMTTLYAYARLKNYVVLGTGNRDEIYMGYFTKWGDGAADIYPLVHLSKTNVYKLASELNVIDEIMNAVPSADLWEGQSDEEEMGVTYQQINDYIVGELKDENAKAIIEKHHKHSLHKINKNGIYPLKVEEI